MATEVIGASTRAAVEAAQAWIAESQPPEEAP